jgi:hypothetical protein
MATQNTSFVEEFVEEGRERISAARHRIDAEVGRARRELSARRRRIERTIEKNRQKLEKQARRQVKGIQEELRGNPVVQRLEELSEQAVRRLEGAVGTVLGALQIASRSELRRLDRKLAKLGKRLEEIEHARQANGRHPQSTPHSHA